MKAIKSTWIRTALVLFASVALFSFGRTKGGEGFEIYLNSKLLVQQFGKDVNTVKTIQLEQASANDELSIRYYHCGQAGKNRTVTIKDEQNKTLKEWHFADGPAARAEMTCKVKDLKFLNHNLEKT